MIDPHVVSLRYKAISGANVEFANPPAIEVGQEQFLGELRAGAFVARMGDHFATIAEARAVVDPFLEAWSITSGLE
jgi:hypothetical protein